MLILLFLSVLNNDKNNSLMDIKEKRWRDIILACYTIIWHHNRGKFIIEVDPISAICESGCGELGRCVQPGVCRCPAGFHGENCDTGLFHFVVFTPSYYCIVTHFFRFIDVCFFVVFFFFFFFFF